jgi:hypothetical protein
VCPGSHDGHPVVVLRTNRSTYSTAKCNHDGHSVVILPCGLKAIPVMETTRDLRQHRVVLYAALVAYLEKIFLEKDRTHYESKRWWRAILIELPKLSIIISLIAAAYSMLQPNPRYVVTVTIILSTIPIAYFIFIFLVGHTIIAHLRKCRFTSEPTFYIVLSSSPT